jgi:hypothetical protein
VTNPGIFSKILLIPRRVHYDVGTKALDLGLPVRIGIPESIERGGGQEIDGRAVEKRPRWERELGDGVLVVEALDIRPVLIGLPRVQTSGTGDCIPATWPPSVIARATSRLSSCESA